jgi:cyclase
MIASAERTLKVVSATTRIVPGHGPLADRAALQRYHTMLSMVRDRIGKLKAAKRSLADVQALKPTAEFDADWGKGFMTPEVFVGLVYGLL